MTRLLTSRWLTASLTRNATYRAVIVASLAVVAPLAFVLVAPGRMFTREMAWDLLFNLSGAWYIHNGFTPHVDFHDPLGSLNFHLTQLGFRLLGPTVLAFLVAELLTLFGLWIAAIIVATPRLTIAAASLFVVQVSLLVLLPINVGDSPNAYSFAMSYNRWGWSALLILGLLVFFEPRQPRREWTDPLLALALIEYMFYTKITFAIAGFALVVAGLWWGPGANRRTAYWLLALAVAGADVLAPHNRPYLADVWAAAQSNHVRGSWLAQTFTILSGRGEFALYVAAVAVLGWLWWRDRCPPSTMLAALALGVVGVFVLSQNQQLQEIPLLTLALFLVGDTWNRLAAPTTDDRAVVVGLCLVYPLLTIASYAGSVAGYARAATGPGVWRVEHGSLTGLAVPMPDDVLRRVSNRYGFRLAGQLEDVRDTAAHYVSTLQEAAGALQRDGATGRKVFTFDQVNALPFVLGSPPPRGSDLWLAPQGPFPPPDVLFSDVDVVLVPTFPSYTSSTIGALEHYASYVEAHFTERHEIASWTILSRAARDNVASRRLTPERTP